MDKIGTVTQDQIVDCLIDFQVHSADELYDTMRSISQISGVDEVQRILI
jgi:GTP pyrophosphokinase